MNINNTPTRRRYNSLLFIRMLIFILGTFLLALGMYLMIHANLGVSTWDLLHIGLYNKTNLPIGFTIVIVGLLVISLKYIIDHEVPKPGTFINALLVGIFFNLINSVGIVPTITNNWLNFCLLLVGIFLMGFGSGMYVSTNLGEGPRDGLTIALAHKLSLSIRLVRTILEATVLILGFILGGPLAFGTILSIFLIGPAFQKSLSFMKQQLASYEEGRDNKYLQKEEKIYKL